MESQLAVFLAKQRVSDQVFKFLQQFYWLNFTILTQLSHTSYFLGYNLCTATATIFHCTEYITMPCTHTMTHTMHCTACLLRCTLNEYYLKHTTNSTLLAYSCCLDVRTAPDVYYYPSDKERRGGCHCSFYCSLLSPPSCLTSN